MDMDSTLINEEGIDLLAGFADIGEQVKNLTTAAMQGQMDFATSLRARVELLSGKSTRFLDQVTASLSFTEGAVETIEDLKNRGWMVGVVSGGFHDVIDAFLEPLDLDFVRANRFRTLHDRIEGVLAPIIGPQEKAMALSEFAASFGIPLSETVAVGDGANDIPMIEAAGLGIAFCAKPALKEVADLCIDERDFRRVLEVVLEDD